MDETLPDHEVLKQEKYLQMEHRDVIAGTYKVPSKHQSYSSKIVNIAHNETFPRNFVNEISLLQKQSDL